jgi:ligand-binding sensor domain-containing protein/serine phosphatase RsbU (regulator of sigma subunit)
MRLLSLILFFFGLNAYSQYKADLQNINIQDGLSQSVVNDILVDSKGFCWVGTQNGLNRFDGYSFKSFYNNPENKFSISSDYITSIAEDAHDNLWIGTRTGLNKYESRKERFVHFGLPSNNIVFPEINVRSLIVDSENFVWVLLPNYLVRINPVDLEAKIFSFGKNETDFQFCISTGLYESSSGNIWFVKGNRLVMFDKVFEKFEFFKFEFPDEKSCLIKVFEKNQKMYIATDLSIYELKENNELKNIHKFSNKVHLFEHVDKIFGSTNEGLYQFIDGKFSNITTYKSSPSNPNRFIISASLIDNSNNLWIGTSGKGIFKTNISDPKFEKIELQITESDFLSDDQVSSIFIDDDFFWISTYEYGLNRISRKTGVNRVFSVDNSNGLIPTDNIYKIEVVNDRMILATERGLIIYKKNKAGELIPEEHSKLAELDFHVYDIQPFGENSFYFAYGGVLYYYNLSLNALEAYVFDIDKDIGVANSYCIEKIKEDLIYVGTSHGLFRFDLRNKFWDRYIFDRNNVKTVSSNVIYSLDYDKEGRLWVGTSNGLDLVDDPFNSNPVFLHMFSGQKQTIYSISSSGKYTWVGTGNGLIRFNTENNTRSDFHKSDGLPCEEFNIGAVYEFDKGKIAFGGQGGVAFFYPDSVILSDFNPEVEVSRAVIYNHKGNREIPVYSGAKISLKVSDFLTNIYFAALDHTAPEKNQYRYKVNGSEWLDLGNQNYASFSNLQPGEYKIEINGSNADRLWSTNVAYLTIDVPRPWYASWWAYMIYTIFVLGLILFSIETRTKRLRLTNQVLKEKEASAKQVAKQKDRLVTLHKDVTESMKYASRIQHALFPTNNAFKRILPNSFVMHRPKDIISGDFYWAVEIGPKVCVAAVDCTGHGVPGALMSVIAVEMLKKTIVQESYRKPAEILKQLDNSLSDLFSTDEDDGEKNIADGMDMGICVVDRETMSIEYAGAVNSLYIVSEGELREIKGNRVPVGMGKNFDHVEYDNHYIEFNEDMMFYMTSDGYPDQFGGNDNKKYKYNRFRNFLVSIATHDMDMQQLLLENNFDKWRGSNEQVDDVLVIGFKGKFI